MRNGHNAGVTGFYKDREGQQRAHRSYDRAMELWDVEYSEEWIETDFGRTHVIVAGEDSQPPLILLPGLFGDATMWYATAPVISQSYRVISVDLPVYGGKSEAAGRTITSIEDYAGWFTQLMGHFQYQRVAVAGLSYGSWLCLALAREIPEAIAAVIMLDPSETFAKMRASMAWKGLRYFVFFPNRSKYEAFFTWMGGGFSDPRTDIWMEHMLDVIEFGSVGMMDVPQHRVYTREELSNVTMPVLILAGGKPIIYKDPAAFAAAAEEALPHAEVEIVPDTGHSLHVERAETVNQRILDFLGERYRNGRTGEI